MVHWINVDLPTKTCTYHLGPVQIPKAQYKGLNELKRDGGWFEFSSEHEAKEFALNRFPHFTIIRASRKL